jgi:hypothetical protein
LLQALKFAFHRTRNKLLFLESIDLKFLALVAWKNVGVILFVMSDDFLGIMQSTSDTGNASSIDNVFLA